MLGTQGAEARSMKTVLSGVFLVVSMFAVGCASTDANDTESSQGAASTPSQSSSEREVQKLNTPGTAERKALMDSLRTFFNAAAGSEIVNSVEFKVDAIENVTGPANDPGDITVSIDVRPVKPGTMDPFDFTNDPVTQSWVRKGKIAPKGQYAHFSGSFDRMGGKWSVFNAWIDQVTFYRDGELVPEGSVDR